MKFDLKPLPWLTLAIGFIIYLWLIVNNDTTNQHFIYGSLTLMITLSLWICLHMVMDTLDINTFSKVFSVFGYIFSITVLFLFGIEEVSYPTGAIMFHAEGIAQALGVALIASFPLLRLYYGKSENKIAPAPVMDDENWEPATEDDLQSDKFEVNK